MWGFFESIFKIGFGVAFGFFVHDTILLVSDHVHSSLSTSLDGWPSWSLIITYPLGFLILLVMGACLPILALAPFALIWNKLDTGNFLGQNNFFAKREWTFFLIVWIYCFWAVQFKIDAIG